MKRLLTRPRGRFRAALALLALSSAFALTNKAIANDETPHCATLLATPQSDSEAQTPASAIAKAWVELLTGAAPEAALPDAVLNWLVQLPDNANVLAHLDPPESLFPSATKESLDQLRLIAEALLENGTIDRATLIAHLNARTQLLLERNRDARAIQTQTETVRRKTRPPVVRFQTGGGVSSSPVQLADGTVVVGSDDKHVYFLSPDGTLKNRYQTGGEVRSSPVRLADGTVVVGSWDKHVYFFHPDGTLKNRYKTGGLVTSSPVQLADGTVVVGSWDKHVYFFNPDGSLK